MKRKSFVTKFWRKHILKSRKERQNEVCIEEKRQDNLYLPWIRPILEQILKQREIDYREFYPFLLDGDDFEKTLFAAKQLAVQINHMAILTDHGAYFENFRETMYRENGLIVEIMQKPLSKKKISELLQEAGENAVLIDFEREGNLMQGMNLYIPIFKKAWESTANLDITVPIGYNTLIVRGIDITKSQPVRDRFEQAFYDKEL